MGPSGSGKSTLMHLLAGLDTPDAGSVHIAGEDITRMSDRELTRLRRKHIGFVFQSFNLLPTLSAEENVLLPLAIAGRKPEPHVVDALLERMGLAERRDHKPAQLSGGQQQRVAVARALIAKPTVLFADEPTGNLDSASGAEVLDLLRTAVDDDGQTTVMVTHDARAAATADRVLFLADGRVVADLDNPTEDQILDALQRHDPSRIEGPGRAPGAHGPDHACHRGRGRVRHRGVHAHGHDVRGGGQPHPRGVRRHGRRRRHEDRVPRLADVRHPRRRRRRSRRPRWSASATRAASPPRSATSPTPRR